MEASRVLDRFASITRRDALVAAAALGLTGQRTLGANPHAASDHEEPVAAGTARRIDVHNHAVPEFYVEAMEKAGYGSVGGVPFPKWKPSDLEVAFSRLEAQKIILSISSPGVMVKDPGQERDLARQLNEYLGRLIAGSAGRLGAFATVPMSDPRAAIAESKFALDELGMNGVCLFSSYEGRYLGDSAFEEYMEFLNQRSAVVFLHPTLPLQQLVPDIAIDPPILEFVFETTRAVTNMLFTGVLERFPQIRFIVAHLGGTVPFVAWRLQLFEHSARSEFKEFRRRCPRPVRDYLAGLYYEVAMSGSAGNLRNVLSFVPPDHILFGSDFPFAPPSMIDLTAQSITSSAGLDPAVVAMIEQGNAQRLFRL